MRDFLCDFGAGGVYGLKPGAISFPNGKGLTLIEAIVRSGGLTRLADKKQVSLRRTNSDGTNEIFIVDIDAIIMGKSDESWPLRPGDVILVSQLGGQRQ